MASIEPPLIVITGPTASGKSGLAMELARKHGGEIICADSRTVYKGMDIGTAKPSQDDQLFVPHHLLDIIEPTERFTAADFQRHAKLAIKDIRSRNKVPFLVGGTGLYIDSVVLDFRFGADADLEKRMLLEEKSVDELLTLIKDQQLPLPNNLLNKRHLIRVLEQGSINHNRLTAPIANSYIVSITTEKSNLEQRIRKRADEMFEQGVLDEAKRLGAKYGWDAEAMTGNIYPILREVIEGRLSVDEAKQRFIVRDRQLAKRQITWLKRHDFVHQLSIHDARREISLILDRFQA
jgi:tRNA dimethylallyltransferase